MNGLENSLRLTSLISLLRQLVILKSPSLIFCLFFLKHASINCLLNWPKVRPTRSKTIVDHSFHWKSALFFGLHYQLLLFLWTLLTSLAMGLHCGTFRWVANSQLWSNTMCFVFFRQLVVRNQIVENSDSKPSEFDPHLHYEPDSNNRFKLMIMISIKIWSIFD